MIRYSSGPLEFEGALIYDKAIKEKRPAVLVGPNWMGMTNEAIARGKLVAGDRYVCLVVDMYGAGKRPTNFGEAAGLANPLRADATEHRRRARAALDALIAEGSKRGLINEHRAAVGFCFGGGNVLELARDGAELDAVVAVHPDLITPMSAAKDAIKAKVLVAVGSADPVVPKAARDAFEAEMDQAGAQWEMLLFSGVYHAYTDDVPPNPGMSQYDASASRQTFALTHAFLADAFAGRL